MPQFDANEFVRAMLEQEQQKAQQKNQNTMQKMRVEALMKQAQSTEDEGRGYQAAYTEVDPLLRQMQGQAEQMREENVMQRRRALVAEATAVDLLRGGAESVQRQPSSDMLADVENMYKTSMRLQILQQPEMLEAMSPFQRQYLFGKDVPTELERAREETRGIMEKEAKFGQQEEKEVVREWQGQMDQIARAQFDPDTMMESEEANKWRQQVSARYVQAMLSRGLQPTPGMFQRAGIEMPVREIPPMERPEALRPRAERRPFRGARLPAEPGGRVYAGRPDITYGRVPMEERMAGTQLTAREEEEALDSSIREVLGKTFAEYNVSEAERERLIDRAVRIYREPAKKEPYGGKAGVFSYQVGGYKIDPKTKMLIFEPAMEKKIATALEEKRLAAQRRKAKPYARPRRRR